MFCILSIPHNIFIMALNKLTKSFKVSNFTKKFNKLVPKYHTKKIFQQQIGDLICFWELHHFKNILSKKTTKFRSNRVFWVMWFFICRLWLHTLSKLQQKKSCKYLPNHNYLLRHPKCHTYLNKTESCRGGGRRGGEGKFRGVGGIYRPLFSLPLFGKPSTVYLSNVA